MTFLNPLLLIGLAAAAIPLLIHLFNFRRPGRVDFSSLVFLKEVQQRTMQRVRIKQWLLLALRTLAIAALVLAFARPTLQGDGGAFFGGRAALSVAVVVDNSLTMSLRDGQGERLSRSREIARGLVVDAGRDDDIFLVTTGDPVSTSPFLTRAAALDAVARIDVRHGSETLADALRRADDLLASSRHPAREIYLFSDFQESLLGGETSFLARSGARIFLIPVGERNYPNLAVEQVDVASRIVEAGQPVRVDVTIRNHGAEAVEGYVVTMYFEDESVAQGAVDIGGGDAGVITLTATPRQPGWIAGRIVIEDDDFPFDNEFFFSLHVPQQRRVLLVRGNGQDVSNLMLALSPELARDRVPFVVEAINEGSLASARFASYDVVVLAGVHGYSSGVVEAIGQYVEAGGGVLLTPAENSSEGAYGPLLRRLGGGQITGTSGRPGTGTAVASVDMVDREHPLFTGVFENARRTAEQPIVFASVRYTPGPGVEHTLIRLSDRQPFLQEIVSDAGRVLLLTSAPSMAWTDLPVRGLFLPLIHRSLYYLSAGESVTGDQLHSGRPATLRFADTGRDALRLTGSGGVDITPEVRAVPGATLVDLGTVLRDPGVYDMYSGTTLLRRLAVNARAEESNLRLAPASTAQERLAAATGMPVLLASSASRSTEETLADVAQHRTGMELWNVLLLLALGFLLAETLVTVHYRRRAVQMQT
jgi:hypothetical protein